MSIENQIHYWIESAQHDLETAESLFQTSKYDWCLYIAHLVLEKTLKAIYVKQKNKSAPKTHQLHTLALELNIIMTEEQLDFLRKVNEFNIEARYPDYKLNFYKLCTESFCFEYFQQIKELHQWLLKKI